jgi:signal transduction histidine kinase
VLPANLTRLASMTLVAVAVLCLGLAPAPAKAFAPRDLGLALHQLKHTAWAADRGAPGDIIEIAQSPDGFLWLATAGGLYRFDGVTFELIPPIRGGAVRSRTAYSLLAARNGDVWVGYYYGGIAVYRNGRLQDANPGKPYGSANSIRQAPDGSVWLLRYGASGSRLSRYKDGRWEDRSYLWDKAFPAEYDWFVFGRDGTIWIAAKGVIQAIAPNGSRHVYPMPRRALPQPDATGRVWIVTGIGAWPAEQAAALAVLPPGGNSERNIGWYVHVDPDGSVLMNDTVDGVGLRWIPPRELGKVGQSTDRSQQETFDRKDGLTSEAAGPILEDREGNLWVGTAGGLDQFRHTSLVSEAPRSVVYAAGARLAQLSNGRLMVIGPTGLEDISNGMPAQHTFPVADIASIDSMCPDRSGGLWLIWANRVVHWPDSRRLAPPPSTVGYCDVDTGGRLWISTFATGIYRWDQTRWTSTPPDPAATTHRGSLLVADSSGGVLVAVQPDGVYRVSDRGKMKLATREAIGVGAFRTILARGSAVEIGGEGGIAHIDAQGVTRLTAAGRPWLEGVASIVHTPSGETWINAAQGVARLRTADFDAALRQPSARLPYEQYAAAEGYQGSVSAFNRYMTAVAPDGRIWFQSSTAWMWIDPTRVHPNSQLPPVTIKGVTAAGNQYAAKPGLKLPEGVRNLQIDYTALSLSAPEKVRFRYRLEGVDSGWVDPGQRRQAFYTNLTPGDHRFRVIAANNDGVWNRTGATLDFRITPAFWQTWPFLVLLAATAAGLLWMAYALRVRQLTDRIQMRMAERLGERERIARDLHDTLLQGVQGLMLRFQAVAEQFSATEAARGQLEQALDRADEVLVEGRERVHALRTSEEGANLAELLESAAHRLRLDAAVDVRLTTVGVPRAVHPVVCDEILAIASEAMFNAFRHAIPTSLQIEVAYRRTELRVTVRDDGVGLGTAVTQVERPGHYGLIGMAERAHRIRGQLTVRNAASGGVEVILSIPGNSAFATHRGGMLKKKF